MSELNDNGRVKDIWQGQKTEGVRMSVEQIRMEAGKFERKIHRRNLREYVAGLLVILCFGYMFTRLGDPLLRVGFGLSIAGAAYAMWNLLTKGSPGAIVGDPGRANWIEFRRAELVRQRDLLRNIWRWYLGPLVPGLAVQMVAQGRINPSYIRHPGMLVATVGLMTAVFAAGGWVNLRGARRLQQKIDELDAQSGD